MRRSAVTTALLVLSASVPASARAQSSSTFGLGAVLGEPTGVTARFWSGGNNFQVHAAWSFSDEGALQLSGDYLRSGRVEADPMIPFYFGLGVRTRFADDFGLGVRVPLGVNHVFRENPVEVFAEIVPILDLAPDTGVSLNGAIGVRYYVNLRRD